VSDTAQKTVRINNGDVFIRDSIETMTTFSKKWRRSRKACCVERAKSNHRRNHRHRKRSCRTIEFTGVNAAIEAAKGEQAKFSGGCARSKDLGRTIQAGYGAGAVYFGKHLSGNPPYRNRHRAGTQAVELGVNDLTT